MMKMTIFGHDISGLKVITDINMTIPYEDWSEVRSKGRARRRRKKHQQRIRIINIPNTKEVYRIGNAFVMHPEMKKLLDVEVKKMPEGIHGEKAAGIILDDVVEEGTITEAKLKEWMQDIKPMIDSFPRSSLLITEMEGYRPRKMTRKEFFNEGNM